MHRPSLQEVLRVGQQVSARPPPPVEVEWKRYPHPSSPRGSAGAYVTAVARGDEIVQMMHRALAAARSNVRGQTGLYESHDSIEVYGVERSVEFSIVVHVEHGGSKVIIDGNVGGERKEHKLQSHQRVDDDWIARATAGLYWVAGGTADGKVEIRYREHE